MFTKTFKYYKSKQKPPDLKDVIDFDQNLRVPHQTIDISPTNSSSFLGLQPPHTWKVFTLPSNPGLIFIRNPFTDRGQRYWIAKCLRDYPNAPHEVNLKNIISVPPEAIDNWWHCMLSTDDPKQRQHLKLAMRWTTLGYHHNWDTKVYTERAKNEFPIDLAELSAFFAQTLRLSAHQQSYKAEAAIVNFYPIGTTLAGHTDHSERDLEAPLFSFSFGQTAIFLIGGQTKDVSPSALLLKSGDIVIMSKESRLCYHAVPRVFRSMHKPWTREQRDNDDGIEFESKKRKVESADNGEDTISSNGMDLDLYRAIENPLFWGDFEGYIEDCRININVRQVLKDGQTTL